MNLSDMLRPLWALLLMLPGQCEGGPVACRQPVPGTPSPSSAQTLQKSLLRLTEINQKTLQYNTLPVHLVNKLVTFLSLPTACAGVDGHEREDCSVPACGGKK